MKRAALVVVRWIAVVALAGVAAATGLFFVTSWGAPVSVFGTACEVRHIAQPGFDPWTGEPHGRIFDCDPFDGSATTRITAEPPDELVDRRAVPLPAGFAVGAFIALVWLTVDRVIAGRTATPRARTTSGP